jgi:pimeloyl-ACP methyl ester carboxylesterase
MAAPGVRAPVQTDFIRRALAGEHPLVATDEASLDALMALATFRPPELPGFVRRALVRSGRAREAHERKIFDDLVAAGEDVLGPLLPEIQAPTLVLWGAEDRLVHPSAAGVFAAGIADAESVVFPECGHGLTADCPELVAERYAAFLAEHP